MNLPTWVPLVTISKVVLVKQTGSEIETVCVNKFFKEFASEGKIEKEGPNCGDPGNLF